METMTRYTDIVRQRYEDGILHLTKLQKQAMADAKFSGIDYDVLLFLESEYNQSDREYGSTYEEPDESCTPVIRDFKTEYDLTDEQAEVVNSLRYGDILTALLVK